MATIGLRVQDSPLGGNLSLADTLARSIFGDPESEINARVKASQVGAHMAYRDKLLADAGLVGVKTEEERHAEAERLRAGPLVGEASALALPMPVPVEDMTKRATVGASGPVAVRPEDLARHDALAAQERALGPILVRGNPSQVAEGVNKNYGGAIIAGATANPAIVNPDSLRLASTLYTGSAPTTSTVLTSNDFAGVDAAARGKILEDRAAAGLPKEVTYRDQPGYLQRDPVTGQSTFVGATGTQPTPLKPNTTEVNHVLTEVTTDPATGKAVAAPVPGAPAAPPEIKTVESGGVHYQLIPDATGRETAVLIPGQPAPVQKPNTFQGPNNETLLAVPDATVPGGFRAVPMAGAPAPLPPAVAVDPSKPLMTRDQAGLHPIPGMPEAPAPSTSIYDQGLTPTAADNKFVGETVTKLYNNQPVSRDEALQYAQSWNNLYATKYAIEVINGARSLVPIEQEKPSPYPKPEVVMAKAGVDPATITSVTNQPVIVPSPDQTVAAPPSQPPVVGGGSGGPPPVVGAPQGPGPGPSPGPSPGIIPLEKPKPPEVTADRARDRVFAPELANATATLDKFGPNDVPNIVYEALVTPTGKDTGNVFRRWAEVNLPSGKDQEYGSAVSLWLSNQLYKLSGAAIGEGEFARGMRGYVPRAGDTPDLIAEKTQRRHDFIKAVTENAFQGDENAKQKFYLDFKNRGVELDDIASGKAPSPKPKPNAPPLETPPASYTGSPESWKHVSVEDRKLFQ